MLGVVKGYGSRMMSKGILMAASLAFLHACGGGGGGDSSKPTPTNPSSNAVVSSSASSVSTSSSASSQAGLVANAGPDLTVNAGERVVLTPNATVVGVNSTRVRSGGLEISGASAIGTDIVKLVWTPIEGPIGAISTTDTTSGSFSFLAPETGINTFVKIVYELAITNADGQESKDTITITVNRVNRAPVADAGRDIDIVSGSEVKLSGIASKDNDGGIVEYNWVQLAGANVLLEGYKTATPKFVAPIVTDDTELEFQLSVKDIDGVTAVDKVLVLVSPKGAPEAIVHFPPANSQYTGNVISVFGRVKTNDSQLAGVTVDAGNGPVAATINGDNSWRVDNLALPPYGEDVTLKVEATDSLGRKGRSRALLMPNSGQLGSGATWQKTVAIALNSAGDKAFVLTSGSLLSNVNLISVDLLTGNRSGPISAFSNLTQGTNASALVSMAYDEKSQRVYVGTAPADTSVPSQVIAIDLLTGMRTLVSDSTKGTGPALLYPSSIQVDGTDLYVSDNKANTILRVSTLTGDRQVIASAATAPYKIDAPMLLAHDSSAAPGRLYMIPNALSNYVLGMDLSVNPVMTTVVTDSLVATQGVSIGPSPSNFILDKQSGRLLVTDFFGKLYSVNLIDGKRIALPDMSIFKPRIDYDRNRKVIIAAEEYFTALKVVDPVTGQKVTVSQ